MNNSRSVIDHRRIVVEDKVTPLQFDEILPEHFDR